MRLHPLIRFALILTAGAILGTILTMTAAAIWANATIPQIARANEEAYYRGVYSSCLVLSQIISGLDYEIFQDYCNKLAAAGREADAYHGNTPGYQPESQERFGGMDG